MAALCALACSSATPTRSTAVTPENCPTGIASTVSNQSNISYDVYFQNGRGSTILGEINAGSTVTFTHPGDGRGRVTLRVRDRGGMPRTDGRSGVRVRTHCVG
jgi:hypothetical protein